MTRGTVLFCFTSVCLAAAGEPVLRSWLLNPNANPALKAILPEVCLLYTSPSPRD